MKRLIFCFDGTWNKLDAEHPTNVVVTAESISPVDINPDGNITQVIYYDEGVGTSKFESLMGGLFGVGLLKNLDDAYRFLIFNYNPGDEIYVFGFSRGAYSARSFMGLIRNCGILQRKYASKVTEAIRHYTSRKPDDCHNSEKMHMFRNNHCQNVCVSEHEDEWKRRNIPGYNAGDFPQLRIKYAGVWDTVGSLGVPAKFELLAKIFNRKYRFHDTSLSRFVESARHAVAIDEKRNSFSPTLWSNFKKLNQEAGKAETDKHAPYQQQWFPGSHGAVGGGGERRGLSDEALLWVLDGARQVGLQIDSHSSSRIYDLDPDHKDFLKNCPPPPITQFYDWVVYWFMTKLLSRKDRVPGPDSLFEVSDSAKRRWHEDADSLKDKELYRPKTLDRVADALNQMEILKPTPLPKGTYEHYVIKQGDDLYRISKKFYGEEGLAEVLFRVNCDQIHDPEKIFVGMSIKIPNKEVLESLSAKTRNSAEDQKAAS